MDIITSATLGVMASLVATFIWVLFTKLYDFDGRRNIDYILEMVLNCARQFEYAIEYNEYQVALIQADRMLDLLKEIHTTIKLFTYMAKKKKLILTYLHNALYIINVFKNVTVGYVGGQEEEARCTRFKRKYLYNIQLDNDYSLPFLSFSFEIIQELNRRCSVKKALVENLQVKQTKVDKNNLYKELVYGITFKCTSIVWKYDIRNSVFTMEEYNRYIDKKIVKGDSHNA